MSESVKLTKAQRDLLELADQGEIEVSLNHPAVDGLSDAGFLTPNGRSMGRGGGILFGRFYRITEAGRAALKDTPQ